MPKRLQLLCIYLGGFLGPFLGQSLVAILPDVAASFDITVQAAAFGITAFLLPFSITMLFSSRLVHGRRLDRIVLLAYVVMATGAIVLAVSDSWPTFVIVYAAMGIANAFTLPLLQTILKSVTPPDELATAISTYAAMQSLGLLSAPLVSGVLADVTNWQYVYFLVAAVLLVILIIRLPQAHPRGGAPAEAGQTPFVALAVYCLCCFAIGFGVIGVGTLVALRANTQMGLSATGAGLVVACGGTAAFLFVRFVGRFADHHGVKRCSSTR
ncbi:hypothetical protein C3B44_08565 [Corynebacterium yudongzhengii]|uniref:MFS transporter n=1 Tax=Corynebacterium yudongzhengii TaxID=2080740 RepID=A0A2U1T4C3_9CORY|nr:MFS transporter [Corynebacterium yudongzhengii]AWB82398.1 hypothetical protein C3B44_08565 [Corynebacterium yudongzhengii]PWC00815.1 MFS transporter [Corynebacterium yudongzhengii]